MGNIVLLDDLTINKIAAGEVIERPASVVKELMENSIDAGATSVTAEIKNGGITYIRITDNGKGFLPDDMEIAFERHATSKIRSAKDLEVVKSMGFRGEALASIAAIAHVELTSRTADSDIGYKIVVEGGSVISKEVVGCPKGTTIVVENLFYNTPVRYKFLKKDFTELGYVEDAVKRIALVNQNVAVKLVSLGKTIIQTTGNGKINDSVYSIYGKETAENIINIDYKLDDMSVSGCVGKTNIAKSNRTGQLFFVNGRFIKDKTLSSAAEQAYRGMLPPGKYGFLILNLNIDPHQIDVNVHPAKLEIRFQEENKIFKLVYHAIKEAFLQEENKSNKNEEEDILELIKEGANTKFDSKELEKQREFIYSTPAEIEEKSRAEESTGNLIEDLYNDKIKKSALGTEETINVYEKNEIKEKSEDNFSANIIDKEIDDNIESKKSEQKKEKISAETEKDSLDSSFEEMYRKTFGKSPIEKKPQDTEDVKEDFSIQTAEDVKIIESKSLFNKVKYKFIGLAFGAYVVIEIDQELYIIDQVSANERVIYENLLKNYYNETKRDSQVMLLPDIVELSSKEMDIARDNLNLFNKSGFDIEEFGENTIKITGVPSVCINLDNKDLFKESLEEINTVARTSKDEIEQKFIATIARKVAKNIQISTTFEQIDSLMQRLLVLEKPFVGANGQSVAIKLSKTEIEKKLSKK
ncbi:MAG: DNA mismatch repair endonuclease MutL [Clostridia bacterium]|nr:DNA mismatch repair endonuclease MutL [Clostridia bacterium]